jgi:predicted tellurium resistance membrane protein TerC
MEEIFTLTNILAFLSLLGLEVILGVDNAIFLAILVHKVPQEHRARVRLFGVGLAVLLRIVMLWGVSWIMNLCHVRVNILGVSCSYRSILLVSGGAFLILKSILELKEILTHIPQSLNAKFKGGNYKLNNEFKLIGQIIFVDLVLSFDSVIVAVSVAENKLFLVIPAIFLATASMLVSAKAIGNFMYENPGIKVLGVAFVLCVGLVLCVEGFGLYVPKSYLYSSMFFSLFVELINIRMRKLKELQSE